MVMRVSRYGFKKYYRAAAKVARDLLKPLVFFRQFQPVAAFNTGPIAPFFFAAQEGGSPDPAPVIFWERKGPVNDETISSILISSLRKYSLESARYNACATDESAWNFYFFNSHLLPKVNKDLEKAGFIDPFNAADPQGSIRKWVSALGFLKTSGYRKRLMLLMEPYLYTTKGLPKPLVDILDGERKMNRDPEFTFRTAIVFMEMARSAGLNAGIFIS